MWWLIPWLIASAGLFLIGRQLPARNRLDREWSNGWDKGHRDGWNERDDQVSGTWWPQLDAVRAEGHPPWDTAGFPAVAGEWVPGVPAASGTWAPPQEALAAVSAPVCVLDAPGTVAVPAGRPAWWRERFGTPLADELTEYLARWRADLGMTP